MYHGMQQSFQPRSVRIAAALSLAFVASTAQAQDLTHKAPPQSGTTCIYNAVIHPVSGPVIDKGFITFRDGRIEEVASGQPNIPAPGAAKGYTAIDAKGLHVYPGLFSPWAQLGITEIAAVRQGSDLRETGAITPEVRPTVSVNPDSTLIPVTRSNGILSGAVFPSGGVIAGQVGVIRLDGWTMEQMSIAPSVGMVVNWPQMRPITSFFMARSPEDQQREARRNVEQLGEIFDRAKAYDALRRADESSPIDLRLEAMRDLLARTNGSTPQRPIFVTANDLEQITTAVGFCKQHKLRMVLVGGRDAPICADLLKENNIPIIVTSINQLPRRSDAAYDDSYTLPSRLEAAGLEFAIASSDDTPHERNLPYAAALAARHGLPVESAIRAITLSPARIMGVADKLGSLEKGKLATLFISDGSPLEITTRVQRAFIDGREIDLSNKQSKLAEKYRERYRQLGQLVKEPAASPANPSAPSGAQGGR